jgi:aminopeptidase N
LEPIDQRGLIADQLELAYAGYQPLAAPLSLLARVPGDANARVAVEALDRFEGLYDRLDGNPQGQSALAARAIGLWKQRLDTLGYDPRPTDALPDATLRSTLVSALGHIGEPGVVAQAHRRFAALDSDPHALDGPLKNDWLAIVARNASPAEWDKLERLAEASTSTVARSDLFEQLGRARDLTLARRALDLALTDKPGKTISSALIAQVSFEHSELAFDFFLAHRDAVLALVDASARTTYVERLASQADSAAMVVKLTAYEQTLPADAKKPVDRALARLKNRLAVKQRVASETVAWLKG